MAASAVSGSTDTIRPRRSAPRRRGSTRSRTSAGTSGVSAASATRRRPSRRGRVGLAGEVRTRRLLMTFILSAGTSKVMTTQRERLRHICSERTIMSLPNPRRTASHGLHLTPETIEEMRSRLPQVAEQTVGGDHRRGAQLRRGAHREDRREHPYGRAAGARRVHLAGVPEPRRGPAHPGRARRSRAPTSSAAARPGAAGRSTRCSRRTGSARGSRGGRCRRRRCATGSRPTPWPASPSWSSPTSTSCPRPAWPATPTSSTRPAACGSDCWNDWRTTCCSRHRRRRCWPPPSAPAGRRRRR